MSRLDVRSDCQVPVTIFLNTTSHVTSYETVTANLGLRGAFVNLPLPERAKVKLKARFEAFGDVEIEGRVVRTEKEGTALQFVNVPEDARSHLWDHIRKSLSEESLCPYCGNGHGNGTPECEQCGRSIDFSSPQYLETHTHEMAALLQETLDRALEEFNGKLADIEERFLAHPANEETLVNETTEAVYRMFHVSRRIDAALAENVELLREKQTYFRTTTNAHFSKSYFMNRARTWPQGYAGDYKTLEGVYRNIPLSTGIGSLLDRYFNSTALAVAVRHRRRKMENILRDALSVRQRPRILNIACGSCREVFDLAPEITASHAMMTCIDHDSDALDFSMKRLAYTDILEQLKFRKYNALRMVNYERNVKEFGMQDVIYSMGFFDYLEDNVLIRLLRAYYSLLNPQGRLIAPFKDCDRYETLDYHWLVDWSAFLQRTRKESRALLAQAGIPNDAVSAERDDSGVIIFYVVTKK
jgi:SAM-dependent methyltransferase